MQVHLHGREYRCCVFVASVFVDGRIQKILKKNKHLRHLGSNFA